MSGREVDPETLGDWIKELDPLPWRQRFSRVLPGERALAIESGLALVRGNGKAMSDFMGMGRANRLWAWLIRPLIKSEIVWVQRRYETFINISAKPYHEQKAIMAEEARSIRSPRLPWYYRASGGFLPDYEASFMKEATLEAMMLATRAGLGPRSLR